MVFQDLICSVLNEREPFHNIWFAGDFHTPPECSYQVNFPRLELVLDGEYINEMEDHQRKVSQIVAKAGDAIFIPPNCWNKPDWDTDCSVLSILFGRRQLGLSLVSKRKGEPGFYDIQKHSLQTRSGFAIDNILEALSSLARENIKKPMDELLLQALLQYCKTMLEAPAEASHNRVQDLYQGICIYIQENFHRQITRDSIASRFSISSNHLSRLFRQQGHMTLADYITWVRIDRAKFMLKKYNFKLNEVSVRCGFKDVNYFCRVFKNRTGRTPSDYRGSI
ncbi:AraC family transcriptional regulator [Vibrio brasiliensis]|jgi:AraC-like DNA-binding protein|uniref:helix-turn-helix domain-containing protein n=1 Tax=Vibrio brasiliensis TaxID=170652 RepID=UPI001EFE4742|nr:AraC family transcriptional regulator [Vibrio brasiliensis]MCG9781309.1 AraC family transcriptional regulator [Vibrio brasiliensis]